MFSGLLAKERESKMEGYREFDKSAEERTLEYFDFTAKVFRWVRIILIPVAVIYAFMMLYAYGHGINPLAGIIGLLCILFYVSYLSKGEKAYQQYAREAREAMEQGSQAPYSPKARELRDKQQKAGKGVYYLIAGMMVFLGLLCAAGGVVIMMLGGSFIFWGSVIFLLSLPCFLIGTFYIHMGRSAVSSK